MAGKTKSFESDATFKYNKYFLKDGTEEVTMTLSGTGVVLKKKDGTTVDSPTFTDLKLLATAAGNAQAADNHQIDLSAIKMKRALSKFNSHASALPHRYHSACQLIGKDPYIMKFTHRILNLT